MPSIATDNGEIVSYQLRKTTETHELFSLDGYTVSLESKTKDAVMEGETCPEE